MELLWVILISLAILGIVIFLAYPTRPQIVVYSRGANLAKFITWNKKSKWLILAVVCLVMFLINGPIYSLNQHAVSNDSGIVFRISSGRLFWIVFSFLFSLGIAFFTFLLVSKQKMSADFNAFIDYYNSKSKANTFKVTVPVYIISTVLLLVAYFLLWNYGCLIYKDKIVMRWFLSTSDKTYFFNEVKSISFVKGGHKIRTHYFINFNNGESWDTGYDLHDDNDYAEITYISKRSAIPIDTPSVNR